MRFLLVLAVSIWVLPAQLAGDTPRPVYLGLDAEFGLEGSTSAQAIEKGILIAIDEINSAGGVLGGRPLALKTTDNRSIPARAIRNLRALAAVPDLIAVFGGRFSPAVIECIATAHEIGIVILAPWSAATDVVENGRKPNYVFRLSLRDSLAMPAMLRHAVSKGAMKVAFLVPNTSWGRSNMDAARRYYETAYLPRNVATEWFNWGDRTLVRKYQILRRAGADVVIFVANASDAVILVSEMDTLPEDQRIPIVSHWGVTGGHFADRVGPALERVDFTVVQTFSFFTADPQKVERFLRLAGPLFGITAVEQIDAPVGVAHAYDLTHILARAVDLAGTTHRPAVRDALERVENYDGLVKFFRRPFSPDDHEALGPAELFMARYHGDGTIRPLGAE